MRACLTLLALWHLAAAASAQVTIETVPARPVRGALFRLSVAPTVPAPVQWIEGSIADEPLHLSTSDGVYWHSLAAAPIEGGDSLAVFLVLVSGERRDTVRTGIGVVQGDYPHERLQVAPSMAQPDSAARARITREVARAREVSRGAHQTPQLWLEPFVRPRPSRITSPFGTAREYNGAVTSRHLGTDFSGAVGTPVLATNRARVALVADFYLAGKVVYLDHGDGLISAYFHLSRALVKTGDYVERGQRIGSVGQSGRVTGPHLHWVTRYGGVTVDPMSVLALLGADGRAVPPADERMAPGE